VIGKIGDEKALNARRAGMLLVEWVKGSDGAASVTTHDSMKELLCQ
jgi:hypothetical protein